MKNKLSDLNDNKLYFLFSQQENFKVIMMKCLNLKLTKWLTHINLIQLSVNDPFIQFFKEDLKHTASFLSDYNRSWKRNIMELERSKSLKNIQSIENPFLYKRNRK